MAAGRLVIRKAWRSELLRLFLFVVTTILAVTLSRRFPGSVIEGELFTIGENTVRLWLPLWWLLPAVIVGNAIWRIYDVRYLFDSRGIESRTGILALTQSITRIRFEDIRSNEIEQSVLDRVLNIGDILLGTAATGGVEVIMKGIASPKEVQQLIQAEREQREVGSHSRAAVV